MTIEYERNFVVMPRIFLPLFDVTEHKDILHVRLFFKVLSQGIRKSALDFNHSYLLLTLERAIFISSCVHRPWRVGRAWACYHTFWQPKKLEKIQDSIAFINKTKTCLKYFFTNPFLEFFGKINFQIWIGFCDLKVV